MAKVKKEILNDVRKDAKEALEARICPKCGELTEDKGTGVSVSGVCSDKHYKKYQCSNFVCKCQWRVYSHSELKSDETFAITGATLFLGGLIRLIIEICNINTFSFGWAITYLVLIFVGYFLAAIGLEGL